METSVSATADARHDQVHLRVADVLLTMRPNVQLTGVAPLGPLLTFDTLLVLYTTTTDTWAIGILVLVDVSAASLLVQPMSAWIETLPIIEITHSRFTLIGHFLAAIGVIACLLHSMKTIPIVGITCAVLTVIGHGQVTTGGVATPLTPHTISATSASIETTHANDMMDRLRAMLVIAVTLLVNHAMTATSVSIETTHTVDTASLVIEMTSTQDSTAVTMALFLAMALVTLFLVFIMTIVVERIRAIGTGVGLQVGHTRGVDLTTKMMKIQGYLRSAVQSVSTSDGVVWNLMLSVVLRSASRDAVARVDMIGGFVAMKREPEVGSMMLGVGRVIKFIVCMRWKAEGWRRVE